MPDQISLFPEPSPLLDKSLTEDTNVTLETERSTLDEIFTRTKAYHSGKEYLDLLKFITKFTRYSPLNCYLIHTQNPYTSFVATANQWLKNFGRRVKSDARPILMLALRTPVLFVYDVAETEGAPLPKIVTEPLKTKGKISSTLWDNTLDNCARDLIKVYEKEDKSQGSGTIKVLKKTELMQISDEEMYAALYAIQINKGLSTNQKYSTLVHELGHLYCGQLGSDKTAWWMDRRDNITTQVQKEIEAESISYLVCRRQKIETTAAEYLADYTKKSIELPDFSLDVILRVAGHIESMGRRLVKKRKKKKG